MKCIMLNYENRAMENSDMCAECLKKSIVIRLCLRKKHWRYLG